MIPTRQMCEQIWSEQGLSEDLKEHQSAVAEFSVKIGKSLNKRGFSLDIPLIEAAALLHDIKKATPHHATAGAEMLRKLGFAEIAPIVESHMRLPCNLKPEIRELTIVFLADKLFIGRQFVTLERRYSEKMLICRDNPLLLQTIKNQFEMALNLKKLIENSLGADSSKLFDENGEKYETN